MNWTFAGVQVARCKHIRFAALLVNDTRGFTRALVYYTYKRPVRIVYLEGT